VEALVDLLRRHNVATGPQVALLLLWRIALLERIDVIIVIAEVCINDKSIC
jgi:hypothetical protein